MVLVNWLSEHSLIYVVVTSRDYADAVNAHSLTTINESLYPGHNYVDLASFLLQPYQSYAPRVGSSHNEEPPKTEQTKEFAVLLDIQGKDHPQFRYLQAPEDLEQSVDDDIISNERTQGAYSTLLFLRGYARPEWLNAVGARYSVDPEFFLRHLNSFFQSTHSNYFTSPALPSRSTSMLRLCITTIGRWGGRRQYGKKMSQNDLHLRRYRAEGSLHRHIGGVSRSSDGDIKLGDSMVRQFSIHDEEHFSIEQDISVYVTKCGNRWIGRAPTPRTFFWCLMMLKLGIIWSDVGNDLVESLVGPWQDEGFRFDSWDVSYLPTLQHASRVAWKPRRGSRSLSRIPERSLSFQATGQRKIPQSASLLHLGYKKKADSQYLASDPFYALNSVFCFVASSELQIINLIEEKLSSELDYATIDQRYHQDVTNILYHKQILKRHMTYLLQITAFIKARGNSDWPKSTDAKMREKADSAADHLLNSFQSLHDRARTLVQECDAGMVVRMNNIQIKEAQSVLSQARVTAKLTKLAFFYVPLSFTTSLFGMNVTNFGIASSLGLWEWALLSTLLLLTSFGFLQLEWQNFWYRLRTVPQSWTRHALGLITPSHNVRDTPLAGV